MRYYELIEAPIGDWKIDPNFDSNESKMISKFTGYRSEKKHWPDADKAAIRNPLNIEKIRNGFNKTPYTINLYFYQSTNPDYDRTLEKGLVDLNWVKDKLGEETANELFKIVNKNSITVLMTNNLSDEGWISIRSPWMMAHRMAHAFLGQTRKETAYRVIKLLNNFIITVSRAYGVVWHRNMSYYIQNEYIEVYNKVIGHALGTMRSARAGKLNNGYEFARELIAQYIITGNITLNPLPQKIHDEEVLTTDESKIARVQIACANFPKKMESAIDDLLHQACGEIWVI